MKPLLVYVNTGGSELNGSIASTLEDTLASYDISFTNIEDVADISIASPATLSQVSLMIPTLVLTDDKDVLRLHENVVDYSPVPIAYDDYLRIEHRLLGIAYDIRQ